jgi:hypothetical protein
LNTRFFWPAHVASIPDPSVVGGFVDPGFWAYEGNPLEKHKVWGIGVRSGKKATQGCPYGYHGSAERQCRSPMQIEKYVAKISGPLLDQKERITVHHIAEAIQYRIRDLPLS